MLQRRKHRITINISGEIFETFCETLARFPTTLLGSRRKRLPYYFYQTDQYFFQRNRTCFESILYFYQSKGTLNCPLGISIDIFEQECKYFGIPRKYINKMKKAEGIFPCNHEKKRVSKFDHPTFRCRNILENPNTSSLGWSFGITSLMIVWLSIVTSALETLPIFKSTTNVWSIIELVINIWFLMELLLRIIFSTNISAFFKKYMNIVDMLAVVPYFLLLIAHQHTLDNLVGIFKTLKFIRVCRLFRFSKHSKRLSVAWNILKGCWSNFCVLVLCFVIVTMLGGTFVFVIEESFVSPEDHKEFTSIPTGLWWCVQTLTTVGYGDLIPISLPGRLFACCFMLLGAITISLPILTIVSQFVRIYPKNIALVSNSGDERRGGKRDIGIDIPTPRQSSRYQKSSSCTTLYHGSRYS